MESSLACFKKCNFLGKYILGKALRVRHLKFFKCLVALKLLHISHFHSIWNKIISFLCMIYYLFHKIKDKVFLSSRALRWLIHIKLFRERLFYNNVKADNIGEKNDLNKCVSFHFPLRQNKFRLINQRQYNDIFRHYREHFYFVIFRETAVNKHSWPAGSRCSARE